MFHTSMYGPATDAGAMTLILTPEQYATWDRGNWDAYRIEQDLLNTVRARDSPAGGRLEA
jgi:hypothetical protein